MKCKSCGFQIKENKKFCTNCGLKIEINLEESKNQINNEKAKDKIKIINNPKYSSAIGNKTKTNFILNYAAYYYIKLLNLQHSFPYQLLLHLLHPTKNQILLLEQIYDHAVYDQ